jgi:hypothetical protein
LWDLVSIDARNGLSWDDDVDTYPEGKDCSNDKEAKNACHGPCSATLKFNLFSVRKMFSPSKNERLTIAPSFDVRCLSIISLRFI